MIKQIFHPWIISVRTAVHIHTACMQTFFMKCVLGVQQMLMYTLYAAQGCSHSPTLISNTDNEETAAVTMETGEEDTEACVVVPLHGNSVNGADSNWIWFPLIAAFRATVLIDVLVLQHWWHVQWSQMALWKAKHRCSGYSFYIRAVIHRGWFWTAYSGSPFSGGHTCTSRRIMAEHAAPGFTING